MNCGVYKITIGDSRFYYGSSKDLRSRKIKHFNSLKRGTHQSVLMQRAWDKYKTFSFEVIEYCEPEIRLIIEQRYIDKFIKHEHNMNCAPIAGGGCREHLTEQHKRNISKGLTGHKRSQEEKEKLKYKRSDETRAKMSKAQRNKSPECIAKISNTLKGHSVSQETKEKLRHKSRKLSNNQIKEIKRLAMESSITQEQLSKMFGVSRSLVSMILSGKVWAEVV